jgi:hypothetical protein
MYVYVDTKKTNTYAKGQNDVGRVQAMGSNGWARGAFTT